MAISGTYPINHLKPAVLIAKSGKNLQVPEIKQSRNASKHKAS